MTDDQRAIASSPGLVDGDVIRILLDLQGQVARVEGAQIIIAKQNAELQGGQRDASESRRRLHDKLDQVTAEARAAATKADAAATAIDQLKPDVAEFVRLRGNVKVGLTVIGIVLMPALGAIGWGLAEAWRWLWTHVTWR